MFVFLSIRLRYSVLLVLLSLINLNAKTVRVRSLNELKANSSTVDCRFVIKSDIDLEGSIIEFAPKSVLVFRNGSLLNGTLVGNHTVLKSTMNNIFNDCIIKGVWQAKYASSTMFTNNMETMLLLCNMTTLSSELKLHSSREYYIQAKDDKIQANVIEGIGNERPIIKIHTADPNVSGLNILGNSILLKNLIIEDDYSILNDGIYGENNTFIGSTISIIALDRYVQSLIIQGCEFRGGTSSSYLASSQVKNCSIVDSKFSGYISDHAVYCSMSVESYSVSNCIIQDVTHGNGLFKVRTSKNLRSFCMKDVFASNLNGYMVEVALQNTPLANLSFDNITVTKDNGDESVFYGFCIVDETRNIVGSGDSYNANSIVFNNCKFDYGYNNNAFVYQGSAKRACVRSIIYSNVNATGSHFGGGNADRVLIKNCRFDDFYGPQGIDIQTTILHIDNAILYEDNSEREANCLFLVNYYDRQLKLLSLKGVEAHLNAKYLLNIIKGDNVDLSLTNCNISVLSSDIYKAPNLSRINLSQKRNTISFTKSN